MLARRERSVVRALGDPVDEQLLLIASAKTGERQDDDRAARRPGLLRRRFERRRPDVSRRADLERINPQRLGNVLERLKAHVADGELDPPLHLPVSVLGERDGAGLGDAFEPGGDVHAVAHQIAVGLLDDIAEVDADPELDAAVFRQARVALDQAVLHLDPAADRVDHATELDQHPVSRALDHPAVVNRDAGIDQVAAHRPEPGQNPVLVRACKPRIADNVGDQNRRELAGYYHSAGLRLRPTYIGEAARQSRTGRGPQAESRRARWRAARPGAGLALAPLYCRYCWMRVVRRPGRPNWSIDTCQLRNSSTVSV